VGWTIFTVVDLFIGLLMLDLMSTTVPPEKLTRLRRVRTVVLSLLLVSAAVLAVQIARHYGWMK